MHSHLQVAALSLEQFVFKLNDSDIDCACPYVQVLVCCVLVLDNVAVWGSFLNPDHQTIDTVCQSIAPADMTGACLNFALAFAFVALGLELLDHSRSNLLSFDHHALALAVWTSRHVIRVISSTTAAVGADDVSVVL